MKKDPAFLFYSKDFYEGTRMMLPEERACYIDLLIYQHQNGAIPNEPKRMLMYCSGVDEATLIATLQAKFKQTESGWVNCRLEKAILERENYKNEQSLSGKIGQFWKKAYKLLSKADVNSLKKVITKEVIVNFLNEVDVKEESTLQGSLQGLLKRCLSNKANVNVNVIEDEDTEKGGMGEKTKKPKIEKVKFAEFVSMTNAEYSALVTEYGEDAAEEFVRLLDNYKGSSGKKYKSDYRTILNWVVERYFEQEKKKKNGTNQGINRSSSQRPTPGELATAVEIGISLAETARNQ